MPIKFFDMFAGIGGFRSGLEAVGGFECVGYCEIDKYVKQVYEAMYDTKGELYFDDARKINPESLSDIDLICGGFPCQSFSIAGERRGFDDVRGTLFFEIARIASAKRPKYLFLENVPGLLNHNQGRMFQTILLTLDELGYNVVWQVCNSKDFGYVLNREAYPVNLKYAGQNVEVTNSNITINNKRQKAEITLTKLLEVNEELGIGKNDEIKNVSFALYANEEIKASDGTIIPKDGLIEIVSVSENGKATFITDIPFGKYYVQEYTTDEHYVLDYTKYEFEFYYTDENTSVQTIEINNGKPIVNKPITGGLEITKKDVSTGELLPNAGFRVKDENGNTVVEGYTDEKGVAKFTLGYGKYTYEEFDAPDGYIIDTTPHEFEIKENGQIVKAEMTNTKQPEPDTPQTGDNSNIGFFIGLGAVAIGGLVAFVIIRFRKKDEDED